MYAENLLGVTQNFLSPDILNKFSIALGESTEKTQKAVKSVIPTLLMGIVSKGQTSDGAENLVHLVNKDSFEDETAINYNDENYLSMGTDAVKGIFGNNLESVVTRLGSETGMQATGITKMLKLSAPLVMGVLGKKMRKEGMSTSGLMGFLSQQKSTISGLVPEGLVGRLSGTITGIGAAATSTVSKGLSSGEHVGKKMGGPSGKGRWSWSAISLFILAVLAAVWWFTGKQYVFNYKQC